jgi:hypothetical protein
MGNKFSLQLDKITGQLTQTAKDVPTSNPTGKPWKNVGGTLNNSIKVSTEKAGKEDVLVLSFRNYGLYLDSGVNGTLSSILPSRRSLFSPGNFLDKTFGDGRVSPVGGKLSFGARVNIRKFGIAPRPWIRNVIDALTEEILDFEKVNMPQQIREQLVDQLKKSTVTSQTVLTVSIS